MLTFDKWFDPNNLDHLKAFDHLNKKGVWPHGFLPDDLVMPNGWYTTMIAKMALCWAHSKLTKKG